MPQHDAAPSDPDKTARETSSLDATAADGLSLRGDFLDSLEFRSADAIPTIGNYQIRRRLGEGGMGTVYLARHTRLNKDVALKVLRIQPNVNQQHAVARFEKELQAIGGLEHPNIVRALDAGEMNGIVYLSMELLHGVDLSYAVQNASNSDSNEENELQRLAIGDACEVARQAALGLQFAHDSGLIHRDVKPSNLMLVADPLGDVCVKVLDLGLALVPGDQSEERLTGDGVAMGTIHYMAPEQASDTRSVDHRADIYALGATLYRLLAGKAPFSSVRHKSPAKTLLALTTQPAPSLLDARHDAPPELVDLLGRMLAIQPEDRPQNLHEVIDALRPLCEPNCLKNTLAAGLAAKLGEQTAGLNSIGRNVVELLNVETRDSVSREHSINDEAGILRQRVKKFWIAGVLSRIEDSQEMLTLRREMCPDAVINPWEGVTEIPLTSSDAHRPIEEVFEDSERSLLILGQPGAGKSVTLLQLTRALLKQHRGADALVPVVLHLSTWTDQRQSLEDWIEHEISIKYQIPRNIGRTFVEDNRLLLLLDGLDEVRTDLQPACVQAINQFLETCAPPGMVVSSRAQDYNAIGLRLKLHGGILLKPLTARQIEMSLSSGSTSGLPLLDTLQKHDSMMDLAKSPLMLSVIKQGFSDSSEDALALLETPRHTQEHIFATFVEQMFRSKGRTQQGFARQQTLGWLGWLAQRMDERNQSVFLIEQLQPGWLATRGQQLLYASILSLGFGLATALVTVFFWYNALKIMDFGESTPPLNLLWLFVQLPIWLMMIATVDFRFFAESSKRMVRRSTSRLHIPAKTILYLLLWMPWPLVGWLTGGWGTGWIISNVLIGLMIAPLLGIQGRRRRVMTDIGTVEALGVSARQSLTGWLWGLLVGYGVYLAYLWLWAHFLLDKPPEWFPWYWHSQEEIYVSISWPLIGGACGMVMGGLIPKVLDLRTAPNHGMKMSLRNASIAGGFSVIVIWITGFLALYFWLQLPDNATKMGWLEAVFVSSSFAVWIAFFVAMIFGGWDLIKHHLTRRMLAATGLIPKDLNGFLKHAARLNFLKRAGGAYFFSHQLLLKYFANREDETSDGEASLEG